MERSVQTYIFVSPEGRKNITIMRKEFENVKNTQVELLEMKTAILKVENSLDEVFFWLWEPCAVSPFLSGFD